MPILQKIVKKINLFLIFFFLLIPGPVFAQTICDSIGSNLGGNWDESNLEFLRDRIQCEGSTPVGIIITAGDLVNIEVNSGKLMVQHIKDLADQYNLDVVWRGWGNPQDFDPVLHPEIINGLRVLSGQQFYAGNEQNYCVAESCPGGQPNPEATALVHQHLLEAGLGIIIVIPPLNTQNPNGDQMMDWREYLDIYFATCPECLANAQYAAANIYAPSSAPDSVDAWVNELMSYYQYLTDKGFTGTLIVAEAGVNPGAYGSFEEKIAATLEFIAALEQRLKNDPQLASIIDKLNFFIMNDETGQQYMILRVCDASGNCTWEIVEYITYNTMIPAFPPTIPEEELAPGECENPHSQEGPLRPQKCTACSLPVLNPTYACSQRFEVSQGTYVYVGDGNGTGEIMACEEGSHDGEYHFIRNWGGTITIDTQDTEVEFINYHEQQTDHESKYLAAYLTGSYGRYGASCNWDDPECVKKVFREAGVLTKLLPRNYQDNYRCQMVTKVKSGQEYNYAVWNGQADTPKMTVNNFSLQDYPCRKESYSYEERATAEHAWLESDKGKNWAFVPLVTYKDAPGRLIIDPQSTPGAVSPANFGLSLPHVGTLFEASKILYETLTPKYAESQLASLTSQNNQVLLATANTASDLQEELDQSSSFCGYGEILGENSVLLAQNEPSGQIYSVTVENLHLDNNGNIQYGVRIEGLTEQAQGNSHIMLGTNGVEPFDLGGGGFPGYYQSDDPDLAAHFGPVIVDANGNFTITVTINNHTIQVDDSLRMVSGNCVGQVDLTTGTITANCTVGLPQPPVIKCGNPDGHTPDNCEDDSAEQDSNPNDLICSAPNPIVSRLTVNGYSALLSQGELDQMLDTSAECRAACDACDPLDPSTNDACAKCSDMSPCDWQKYPGRLSRQIGVKEKLPYFQTIGHWLISDYYYYTDSNGNFEENPDSQTYGVFDIFRPAGMNHFDPWQAKSSIGYEYSSAWANRQGLSAPDSKPFVVDPNIDRSEGDFYYPWLGGMQWAKKCVSEEILVPNQLITDSYCPETTSLPATNPTVVCPTLGYQIDLSDTATAQTLENNKQLILSYVNSSWPNNHLEENWDMLINRALSENFNPAFLITLYIEESGAQGVPANDPLGCGSHNNLPDSLNCFFNDSVAYTRYKNNFESFMLSYSSLADLNRGCFATNPNFPTNIQQVYQRVTGTSF